MRGRGLLLGVELVTEPRHARSRPTTLAEAVLYRALDDGLSFKTTMGNVLTLTPPLTVTQAEMMRALDILEDAVKRDLSVSFRGSRSENPEPIDRFSWSWVPGSDLRPPRNDKKG